MDLSYEKVAPFIKVPVPASLVNKVTAWQTSIEAELIDRYGAALTDARAPIFQNLCGEALGRRIVQPTTNIRNQSTGPSSIGYADALGGWFLDAEVSRMDSICRGVRLAYSTKSARTGQQGFAPDSFADKGTRSTGASWVRLTAGL
jgi:hypothetical protein